MGGTGVLDTLAEHLPHRWKNANLHSSNGTAYIVFFNKDGDGFVPNVFSSKREVFFVQKIQSPK